MICSIESETSQGSPRVRRNRHKVIEDPGFRIVENVFSDGESDFILNIIEKNLHRRGAGMRNLMSCPEIAKLAADDRLVHITENITGQPMVPFKATLFKKTGKANWLVAFHQDTALPLEGKTEETGWGPFSLKEGVIFAHAPTSALQKILAIRIHLDASLEENGPLRVIANSHHKRILDDQEFARIVKDGEEVKCLVGRGGVIAMSPLIFHASSKSIGNQPRRVLHIEYAASMDMGKGIKLALA